VVVLLARGRLTSRLELQSSARLTVALLAAGTRKVAGETGSVCTGTPVLRSRIFICYTCWITEESRFYSRQGQETCSKRPDWDHSTSHSMGRSRAFLEGQFAFT
jgi:predicted amidohydrolase